MTLTVDKNDQFVFKVNGHELVSTEQKVTAHEILEQAAKEGAIPGNPQDYELKSLTHDDHVYGWDDDVDLSIDSEFTTVPAANHPNPVDEFNIFVNTRAVTVHSKDVTFQQIVDLAFDRPPSGSNIEIRVTFRDAAGPRNDGSLTEGHSVQVQNGTEFIVTATDKS